MTLREPDPIPNLHRDFSHSGCAYCGRRIESRAPRVGDPAKNIFCSWDHRLKAHLANRRGYGIAILLELHDHDVERLQGGSA